MHNKTVAITTAHNNGNGHLRKTSKAINDFFKQHLEHPFFWHELAGGYGENLAYVKKSVSIDYKASVSGISATSRKKYLPQITVGAGPTYIGEKRTHIANQLVLTVGPDADPQVLFEAIKNHCDFLANPKIFKMRCQKQILAGDEKLTFQHFILGKWDQIKQIAMDSGQPN